MSIEKWVLKRSIKKAVLQGGQDVKIIDLYSMIIKAARNEYTEDNNETIANFLRDLHEIALNKQV